MFLITGTPKRFVEGIALVAERSAVGVEGYADMRRLLLRQHLFQGVEEAKDGRDIFSATVNARILNETIVSAVDERVGVEQE